MKGLLLEEVGKTTLADVPIPELADNEVLLRAEYVGICGSDMHVFKGSHAFRRPPVILGHEIVGTVEKRGKSVTGVQVGDRVTVLPQASCGSCSMCRKGSPQQCLNKRVPGTDAWIGSFAEYFNVPENLLYRLPDTLGSETAVLAEPLAVSVHLLKKIPPDSRERLLILGSGTIGLLTLMAARSMGFQQIVTTDVAEYNLNAAVACGADAAVDVSTENLEQRVLHVFDGQRADAVVISAGAPNIMDQAIENVRALGTIVYVAMITKPLTSNTYPIVFKELSLVGTLNYTPEDFQLAVDYLAAEPDRYKKLITHCYDFEDGQKALEMMDSRQEGFVKVLLKL